MRLIELMSRNRFETISAFLHVVKPSEEATLAEDPLKKVRPLYDNIKDKCLLYYQPLQELSVDERMVKSKARSKFKQYIRNKPTKWGFKFWVLADPTGYTCDFELYLGKRSTIRPSGFGLGYDTVMELTKAFQHQGYRVFFDNFYTSPALLSALKAMKIFATGTLRSTRSGVPDDVKRLITVMKGKQVPHGTGYYIREPSSSDVYVCWRDNDCVTVLSNAYPGHSDGTARRASKDTSGSHSVLEVPLPSTIKYYNKFMGGVDKSDQYISYHRILRQTKRYWNTIFYHLLEICTTNSYILYKWLCM